MVHLMGNCLAKAVMARWEGEWGNEVESDRGATSVMSEPRPDRGTESKADETRHHELVRRAQRGDGRAWEALTADLQPTLQQVLRPFVDRLGCELDDLVQEVHVRALSSLHGFREMDAGSFSGWFLTLARHCALDLLRRVQAQRRDDAVVRSLSSEETSVLCTRLSPRTDTTPSRAERDRETARRIEAAFDELSPMKRWLVRQKTFTDATNLEILVELGSRFPGERLRTVGALSSAYSRALAELGLALERMSRGER